MFSGNELGALLGWWSLFTHQRRHPDQDLSNVYMISSTVSSKILKTMAKQEKFNFEASTSIYHIIINLLLCPYYSKVLYLLSNLDYSKILLGKIISVSLENIFVSKLNNKLIQNF